MALIIRNNYFSLNTCIVSFVLISLFHFQHSNAVKGGYFTPDNGAGLNPSDIDSTLFTHLFCSFANLNTQTNQITLPKGCSGFPRIVKQRSPTVQALLSIGGGDESSSNFNTMASNPSSRKTFIDSTIEIAVKNGFNGLDLDWEQQQTKQEMNNLADLLREWRAAINAQSSTEPLLLTAALRFTATADTGVPFPAQVIVDNLDWVNAMAYDFYAPKWAPKPYRTQPHASLRDPGSEVSGSSGITAWINAGVPSNKLVLGLPFYGYAWTLVDPNKNGILAPSSGNDTSVGNGVPTYQQIKEFISRNGATVKYNSTYVANYCYSGTTWIGYDDTESIKQKVLYARSSAYLRGYFAWNIVQDSNWILSKTASQTWGVDR